MDLEALADSQGPLTRQLAYMLGGDIDAAEDVHQEAMLRAWRRLPDGLDPMAQRAWFARTARNLAIDELRAAHVAPPFRWISPTAPGLRPIRPSRTPRPRHSPN
jgi:RNA polymerase sigma factor (sigma-70 family)